MVRKLILAVVILAMAAVPVPALARDGHEGRHEFRGGHERFERHGRFERFHRPFFGYGFYPYPYYPYPYYPYRYYGAPYYFPRR
jgi:hypothetical protein